MPTLDTTNFGLVQYDDEAVLEFPAGIPAFEDETRFVALQLGGSNVLFLQSVSSPGLAFITVPASVVDPAYKPALSAEDLATLGLSESAEDDNLMCLAIVTTTPDGPATANLMAPLVVHRKLRRAVQSIQADSRHQVVIDLTEEGQCW